MSSLSVSVCVSVCVSVYVCPRCRFLQGNVHINRSYQLFPILSDKMYLDVKLSIRCYSGGLVSC